MYINPSPTEDIELEKELLREHLRRIIENMELDAKTRMQAIQMLGKDLGMWPAAEAGGAPQSLQILIADMRGKGSIEQPKLPEQT